MAAECALEMLVDDARRIVAIVGAGISRSCGIPDFRSPDGIYAQARTHGVSEPELLFDAESFALDPRPFYSFLRFLIPPADVMPSRTHFFLAQLAAAGKLRRVISQNLDGLELAAGLSPSLLVQVHGNLASARCPACRRAVPLREERADAIGRGEVLRCTACPRAAVLRPSVVFFGEAIAPRVARRIAGDLAAADLVLVLGTSLSVAPVSRYVALVAPTVPRVLINRDKPASDGFTLVRIGDCDEIVEALAARPSLASRRKRKAAELDDGLKGAPHKRKSKA